MNNQNPVIHLEDLGDTIKVEVNGSGGALINLIATTLIETPGLKHLFGMALMEAIVRENSQQEPQQDDEASFIEMLNKMKIGLA
jgi:hypothetical protein